MVAAAIDKYVYLTQHRTFQEDIIIKYSKLERVKTVEQIATAWIATNPERALALAQVAQHRGVDAATTA